jgi:ATP-dependent Clp protease, protease subunit
MNYFLNEEIEPEKVLEKFSDERLINKSYIEKRMVFLWGGVNDESAKHVIDRLLYLESEKPGEEINFYINSPGGYVTAGMAVYDTMQMISSPVNTICMGLAASMGSILLSGGRKGGRKIFKNGRVMIHQPSLGGYQGTASDIEIQTKEIIKTMELSAQILADNCGQKFESVMKDFNRDYWMNSEESIKYGIVDSIQDKI